MKPMHHAAQNGREEAISFFIESGVKVDERDSLKRTPLHIACEKERMEVVQLLLRSGADINALNGI